MITIIGAGPAGLYTAYLLAKNKLDVQVFDQKSKIGLPVQCTGIVTTKILDLLDISEGIITNRINNVEVHSQSYSTKLELNKPDIVLDRQKFDDFLAKKAKDAGAKILLNRKFIGIDKKEITLKNLLTKQEEKINTDYLIGADGPLSTIYNILNKEKRKYYIGMQLRVMGEFAKDTFQVHLGSICKEFFAWVVPESDKIARVGLATKGNPKPQLKNFLEKLKIKKAVEVQAGLIPIYSPRIKTRQDNIYLIGDAATQIKSSTGGGIVQDLIAAKTLVDSIIRNEDYEKNWKKNLGKDLWLHLKIRKVLDKFTDNDYNTLVSSLQDNRVKSILENYSRDSPTKFILKLAFAKPSLAKFAFKLF